VLDRLTEFSKLKVHASSRCNLFGRVLYCTIVVGNVVGLCCNIAGSVFFLKSAHSLEQFNVTTLSLNPTVFPSSDFQKGIQMSGVFFGFEAIMLPLIVISFFATGAASVRRIRAAMTAAQNSQQTTMLDDRVTDVVGFGRARRTSQATFISGRRLKRQIVGTCGVLFVSFFIRTAFSLMMTVGALFRKGGSASRCDESQSGLMLVWMLYTPELLFFVTILCQPVTLLVTLWGMTSGQTIAVMRANILEPNS
jgi:hypothetical protein